MVGSISNFDREHIVAGLRVLNVLLNGSIDDQHLIDQHLDTLRKMLGEQTPLNREGLFNLMVKIDRHPTGGFITIGQ